MNSLWEIQITFIDHYSNMYFNHHLGSTYSAYII